MSWQKFLRKTLKTLWLSWWTVIHSSHVTNPSVGQQSNHHGQVNTHTLICREWRSCPGCCWCPQCGRCSEQAWPAARLQQVREERDGVIPLSSSQVLAKMSGIKAATGMRREGYSYKFSFKLTCQVWSLQQVWEERQGYSFKSQSVLN